MEKILEKIKGYLVMEEDLPYEEFQQFYTELIGLLTAEFEEMSSEVRVQGRYVCQVVASNAQARAGKSRSLAKKFKKIAEKCTFWVEAIDYRLGKEGLSKKEIERMTEAVEKAVNEEIADKGTSNKGAASGGVANEKASTEEGVGMGTDQGKGLREETDRES